MDTYSESAQGIDISRGRAVAELRAHGITGDEAADVMADLKWTSDNRTSAYDLLLAIGY